MTIPFRNMRYRPRFAADTADLLACQQLRRAVFRGGEGIDADPYDALSQHLMVHDPGGRLVGCLRLFIITDPRDLQCCYAGQFYDLSALTALDGPLMEIGRFCVAAGVTDTDVLRSLWAVLTRIVDETGVVALFGCSSFQGTDPAPYGRAITMLRHAYQGPERLRPDLKTVGALQLQDIVDVGDRPMPSLLRSYLAMGGWVGGHIVPDRLLGTWHIFTCLEVARVPAARALALRRLARALPLA